MNRTLLVVGAGPKALAIHVRAQIMQDLKYPAPNVLIIEQHQVGANWDGTHGYTDGNQKLVTAAEKDLGFPYKSRDPLVDLSVANYSWQSFMISKREFGDWVDRNRELQTHLDFASYLRWVEEKSCPNIIKGQVRKDGILRDGDEWVITYKEVTGTRAVKTLRASAIVITGPGEPRRLADGQAEHPSITNGKDFWLPKHLRHYRGFTDGNIAVIGSGDTAASVVVAILDLLPRPNAVRIDLFSKMGVTFSRGDSLGEIRWSANPDGWEKLPESGRSEFIRRTERGVFSDILKSRIDAAMNTVKTLSGVVREATMDVDGKRVRLKIEHADSTNTLSDPYRRVIVAIGFRRWSFEDLFLQSESLFPYVSKQTHGDRWENVKEEQTSKRIRADLSFKFEYFNRPRLYLPFFAGLNCGPGFSNLGCLGLLSERVIRSHLDMLSE